MSTLNDQSDQFTITTGDGRGLHCRRWGAEKPDRIVVIIHGLGEHSGCYDSFANAMSDAGLATYAFDQHGHGKSPGVRGHAPSLKTFVGDIGTACLKVADEHPGADIILLGHSMGGHFVLRFLLDDDRPPIADMVTQAIVTNPMILPKNPPTKPQSFAAWLTSKIIPRIRVSTAMDLTQLTQDPEMRRRLSNDPLLHENLSLGVGGKLMSSGHQILEQADSLTTELLFLIGEDDDICDRKTSKQFCECSGNRCTTKTFDGLRHSLLIEQDREQVYDTILEWLANE